MAGGYVALTDNTGARCREDTTLSLQMLRAEPAAAGIGKYRHGFRTDRALGHEGKGKGRRGGHREAKGAVTRLNEVLPCLDELHVDVYFATIV